METRKRGLGNADLETRVPSDHPLRVIRKLADQALEALSPDLDRMYANVGRPPVPPERLLKSSLLIALYSARSERAFCEQLDYNLLFRWFPGMNLMEPSFDATTFTKNRERLLKHGVGQALFGEAAQEADRQGLLPDERFTVDGTLIEAAASLKGFKPRDGGPPPAAGADPGNPPVDFHGERRSNATHQSAADPEARLLRKGKGKEAKLVFMAQALMENRHGMLVDFQTTPATGTAERDIVPELLEQARRRGFHPQTLGGDQGYGTRDCVAGLRRRGVTPHVAQNTKGRSSAIDGRTTRHPGYAVSQRIRKRVEEIFGWMQTVGGFRRTRRRGLDRAGRRGTWWPRPTTWSGCPGCWVRQRQLRKPGWHDLTMGCLCPALPKRPVRKTGGAESPVRTAQYPPVSPNRTKVSTAWTSCSGREPPSSAAC